jgi:hypothetical protein
VLKGDTQGTEPFRLTSEEAHRGLGEGVPLAALAGLESLNPVLPQDPNLPRYPLVDGSAVLGPEWRLAALS